VEMIMIVCDIFLIQEDKVKVQFFSWTLVGEVMIGFGLCLSMSITFFDDLDDAFIDTFLEPFSKEKVVCDLSFPKDIVDVILEDTLNTEGDIIQYGHDEHATMGFQQTQFVFT
jgi:hypothetical protein